MSASTSMAASSLSDTLRAEVHANLWRGPVASTCSSTSSSSLTVKPVASSVRTIKRKPVPPISADLLQQQQSSSASSSTATTPTASVLRERALNARTDSDAISAKTSAPADPLPIKSTQRPQQQYILDIDVPAVRDEAGSTANETVQQLLRSASVSPASAATRQRKGPLRWMQDKEEHVASASTSTLAPPQPTLSRKTSISAHLKLSLRRNKADDPPAQLAISGPSNFVHVSTGTEGAYASANTTSLRRASTTSKASIRSSLRSSVSSTRSSASTAPSDDVATKVTEPETGEDKPLYTATERKHPLRPLRSIRRPSKLSLAEDQPVLNIPARSTSPKDKRKAMYAAPGSVPAILEPVDVAKSGASKLSPTVSSVGSQAGEHFAAALGRTIGRTRGLSSDGGELSPEPELSRSPSSGYASSACTSNRSSLGSLHEFKSFLEFPDMQPGSRGGSEKGTTAGAEDIWSGAALALPLTASKC